jgi:hypothetical protein
VKVVRSGHPQTILVQSFRVLGPSHERPHFRDFRQVRGVQASDGTAADNADSLDQIV